MYKVAKEKSKLIDFTQVFDLMAVTARESIRDCLSRMDRQFGGLGNQYSTIDEFS